MFQRLLNGILILLLLASVALPLQLQADEKAIPSDLTDRVKQFYAALQMNQVEKAGEFVLERSRSGFKTQARSVVLEHKIDRIDLSGSGDAAVAQVTIKTIIPGIAIQAHVPMYTAWKKEAGTWYMDASEQPKNEGDKFREYYLEKEAARKKDPKANPVQVKFDKQRINLGIVASGRKIPLTFPFTNLTDKELRIEKVHINPGFMKDLTQKRTVPPHGKGEVVVEFETLPSFFELAQSVIVEFEPIKEMIPLTIRGRVVPPGDLPTNANMQSKGVPAKTKPDSTKGSKTTKTAR